VRTLALGYVMLACWVSATTAQQLTAPTLRISGFTQVWILRKRPLAFALLIATEDLHDG
jgi:hypothetical protein